MSTAAQSPTSHPRYAISARVAWLDAADGGRDDTVAWAVDLDSGNTYVLPDAAWLTWMLLADGPADVGVLHARALRVAPARAPSVEELTGFLDQLVRQRLVVAL